MARIAASTLAAAALLTGALAAPASAAPLVRADADTKHRAHRLPSSFLGFSQEYNQVEMYVGNPNTGVNHPVARLFLRLRSFGSGAPVLRIGGVSTDATWFNATEAPKPPGININMRPSMVTGLATFARTTGAKLLPGLNLGYNDPAVAVAQAEALREAVPQANLLGFEIGNEPDFYEMRPMYENADGTIHYTRPSGYGPRKYGEEIRRFVSALRPVTGSVDLAGPSISLVPEWTRALPRLFRGAARGLELATVHQYPLLTCGREPGKPGYPTTVQLLSEATVTRSAVSVKEAIDLLKPAGRKVRVSESNSVACGGAHTVSNTQAAALWLVDHLFSQWFVGAQGVDMHSSSPFYRPFGSYYDGAHHGIVSAPYYGMLVFAEATANRARLLPRTYFGQRRRAGANVKVWSVYDATEREVRVVVLNKDLVRRGKAVVRIRGARRRATLKRLLAPSAGSFDGLTWGGQSFATPTDDGELVGEPRVDRVKRARKSRFRFSMPKASAALLTVPVRRARR